MSYRPGAHASVVVDVADLAAAAGVFEIVEGQAVVVTFDMAIALSHPPAGRLLLGKMRGRRGHRPASSGPARDLDHIRVCLSRPPRPRFTECDPKAVLPAMVSGDAACVALEPAGRSQGIDRRGGHTAGRSHSRVDVVNLFTAGANRRRWSSALRTEGGDTACS